MTAPQTNRPVTQLTVRDIPPEIMRELREEAEEKGLSVNAIARAALAEHVERRHRWKRLSASLPELDALRARIRREHGGPLDDSTPLLREDRQR